MTGRERVVAPTRRFTVTGHVGGKPATVSWIEGELVGDDHARTAVDAVIVLDRRFEATPTGPSVTPALTPPWVALLTVLRAFDRDPDPIVAGDPVDMSALDVPPDAVP